ncbi:NAD(P)-dependent dehydrogenase (short-subunit alcohol dehydrogenase family) [Tamilnaduibacter salinus]|uniref:NAD(P)-dependent dehydrogenase (Short-subunit alcohol dehydrogenase family) n=1 Tax=Tamilnaduibacter salinus TaxID=1484056 RepID=A0A2U1CXJ2_9GAMM|nr:SDR family oxidoreductase [Tamilnaduibacter salinus]PVY76952.1 NAD(P)-dependent dehydrogenase (short-subunit alcohol dehydrogenase family) [Tamilnaduibacter salinus]
MRNIIVAGASGAIGEALVRQLAGQGDVHVWALCRQPRGWLANEPDHVTILDWEASSMDLGSRLADRWGRSFRIDGVIYAAGLLHDETMSPEKRLEELSPDALQRAFVANASGFLLLVQSLMPWLSHRGLKRLMAVSAKVGSIGDNGMGGWYAYRASKAALNMMVRTLSIELHRRARPVACVAVHPGTTYSPLSEPFQQSLAKLPVRSAAETAQSLLALWDRLDPAWNGQFVSWDGSPLPW